MNRTFLLTSAVAIAMMALLAGLAIRDVHSLSSVTGRASSDRPECEAMWRRGFELTGVVGNHRAQAYFDLWPADGAPELMSGVIRFPDERAGEALADTLIGVAGPVSEEHCAAQLKQGDGSEDGFWRLRIESPRRMTGTRQTPDGSSEAIVLDIVPETPCNAAKAWHTFASSTWPITFDYPTDWTITEDVDSITIECASITHLATTRPSLIFERGRFPPTDANASKAGESFTQPYWFVRLAGDDWRVDSHQGTPSHNGDTLGARARRSLRNGTIVLQGAAGEHRLYRPGVGELGRGAGITRYLFMVDAEWVSLDAAGENSHYTDIGSAGGPVLFDGDKVADRVVRSVAAKSR